MLQRAARNAYSWWWASHIRTKQSKWLEQNLQDMEEKVDYILKIINEDGDSFRVRAEQYYKKRPEIVNFVEDCFRGYRALAERYDHLSRDLQSANRTIATVYPERVQMSMDEEEYEDFLNNFQETDQKQPQTGQPLSLPEAPKPSRIPKVGNVVQAILGKKTKMPSRMMSKRGLIKMGGEQKALKARKGSGLLSKTEALEEIDKLQKGILGLQTEKEFVKSSYENGLAKYWEIENMVTEMQAKVCNLQDQFGVGTVIEDDDARSLMSSTALKSCQETLARLQDKQRRYRNEAKLEFEKVEDARKKFAALIGQDLTIFENSEQKEGENVEELKRIRIKEEILGKDGDGEMSMSKLAEKIDEIADNVISLETDVSSQTALVMRLRMETTELHEHLQNLEEDKEILVDGSNSKSKKIKEFEEELKRVQSLDQKVKIQDENLEICFKKACVNLEYLSESLLTVKPDEEIHEDDDVLFQEKKEQNPKLIEAQEESQRKVKENEDTMVIQEDDVRNEGSFDKDVSTDEERKGLKEHDLSLHIRESSFEEEGENQSLTTKVNEEIDLLPNDEEDQPNWRQLLAYGLEDREKMLLEEYTSTLKNYKEARKKANEMEKRNRASSFKSAVQIKILRNSNATKDAEIRSLNEKLQLIQKNPNFKLEKAQDLVNEETVVVESQTYEKTEQNDEIKKVSAGDADESLGIEEKIRMDIDDLLNENIEFWLRFGTSYQQIKKFQDSFQDLLEEITEVKRKKREFEESKEGKHKKHESRSSKNRRRNPLLSLVSDIRPLYRHLRDLQTELTLWMQNNGVLRDDLQNRLSSLLDVEKEISNLTNEESKEEELTTHLSKYQIAKFLGEVVNMKHENSKVEDELRVSADRVKRLQSDIEKTLMKLDEELGLNKNPKGSRVPLSSFLFGVKLKKQRPSFLMCMSPALQKQYGYLASIPSPR